MATKPINNSGVMNSLSTIGAQDAAKSREAGIAGAQPPLSGKSHAGTTASDVSISHSARNRAEAAQKAFNIAKNTPDVREDRVAMLKKQIEDGTYKADSGKIADGMLREAILDHLAETEER